MFISLTAVIFELILLISFDSIFMLPFALISAGLTFKLTSLTLSTDVNAVSYKGSGLPVGIDSLTT